MSKTMHPSNPHNEPYPFDLLVKATPELEAFVHEAKSGRTSIDFGNPKAIKQLNKALLKHYYQIDTWDIPAGYLCPPVPGRAEYIHQISDLVTQEANVLDIGVGANCIYPIIGVRAYDWNFVGTDTDQRAIDNAQKIVTDNEVLQEKIFLRHQLDKQAIFHNVIRDIDRFDISMCNPPFFKSAEEAQKNTARKNRNLRNRTNAQRNFKGKANELWTEGGELQFVAQMIAESQQYKYQIKWFTALISREKHIPLLTNQLISRGADYHTKDMALGQKKSRILCWRW